MKRILVPTDFSEFAENAVRVGAELVRKTNGRLFLLHVVEIPKYLKNQVKSIEETPEGQSGHKYADKMFNDLFEMNFMQGINTAEIIRYNSIIDNINDFINENSIDLVIIGSHGISGFKEYIAGSNTQKIVRTANCPVLTVKRDTLNFIPQNVVFASDFSKDCYSRCDEIISFVESFSSKLHLLKVITKNDFEKSLDVKILIEDFIQNYRLKNTTINIITDISIEEGIFNYCSEINADMILLSTEGRSSLLQVFHESIAEKVVNHSKIPVLSFKTN